MKVDHQNSSDIHTYSMVERSERMDFEIRDQSLRSPISQVSF